MANFIAVSDITSANLDVNTGAMQNTARVTQYIEAAMFEDVRPLLGNELYWDVVNDAASYSDLLNGSTYTYGSYSYTHKGVKELTIYFWYARYRYFGREADTAHGFGGAVSKGMERSSERRDQNIYDSHRRYAMTIWEGIYDFLTRNSNDYPLWFGGENYFDDDDSNININKSTLN